MGLGAGTEARTRGVCAGPGGLRRRRWLHGLGVGRQRQHRHPRSRLVPARAARGLSTCIPRQPHLLRQHQPQQCGDRTADHHHGLQHHQCHQRHQQHDHRQQHLQCHPGGLCQPAGDWRRDRGADAGLRAIAVGSQVHGPGFARGGQRAGGPRCQRRPRTAERSRWRARGGDRAADGGASRRRANRAAAGTGGLCRAATATRCATGLADRRSPTHAIEARRACSIGAQGQRGGDGPGAHSHRAAAGHSAGRPNPRSAQSRRGPDRGCR